MEIPLERVAVSALIWVSLMATTRAMVLAGVANRRIPPIVGALALGLVMALPPWIFIATGAMRPAIGAALLVSVPAGIVMAVGSVGILKSERDKHRDADE